MNIKTKKLLSHLCIFSGLMLAGNLAHAACNVSASGENKSPLKQGFCLIYF